MQKFLGKYRLMIKEFEKDATFTLLVNKKKIKIFKRYVKFFRKILTLR